MSRCGAILMCLLVGCAGAKSRGDGPVPEPEPAAEPEKAIGGPSGDPVAGAQACEAVGGTCVGVGDCGRGAGFLTDTSCQSHPGVACCLPTCGTATEDFECCDGGAQFRPSCVGGQLVCQEGRTRCP